MKKAPRKSARFGTCLLLVGLLLVLGAGGLTAFNLWDSNRAAKASNKISEQLMEEIKASAVETSEKPSEVDNDQLVSDEAEEYLEQSRSEGMPAVEIEGYAYIGLLEIPSLELCLPVMDTWDDERLKISPCLYAGSYFTDDMVICAHNYSTHFSSVRWISVGAEVNFTTVDGIEFHYTVTELENLDATQIDEMIHADKSAYKEWDLTLFTCNTGGQTRCAVRCRKTPDA